MNERAPKPAVDKKTYLVINVIFAGIIVAILLYSGIFNPENNNYPVQCIHEKITGEPCPSCGLSRSFSYILRADLKTAMEFNKYGLRVFLFFSFHLVMRVSNILYISLKGRNIRQLIILDSVVAGFTFIIAFGQFFIYYLKLFF